ncbi:uncharacterized protein LOC127881787 [Dreissena polymorpha]|uniref:uncharacterized protein LOC127881778 n=1 Tax=Dreissena polymorpha TaxID=45954 RepID=UPI0022648561|nr:uncharacterized protein LOC127881778 [Dreissena polymorpha]XP_052285894.1 uncharacterized protein LOC127881787 [Dreissena polymorpha]
MDMDKVEGSVLNDQMCLAYKQCIHDLAQTPARNTCSRKGCGRLLSIQQATVRSALRLKWVCEAGHVCHIWSSQPVLKYGLSAGDLRLSAAILFSGNNFQKFEMLARYLNMPCMGSASFHHLQRHYLVPAVEQTWEAEEERVVKARKSQQIVMLGDGRMDSPGHSAQYCSYFAMDNASKEIISVVTVDKRETGKSSTRMEKEGFLRTLENLDRKGVLVAEVVTDAHPSIAAYMRKDKPDIKHSFDIWHVGKNLAKKILKACLKKQCSPLKAWLKHIVNHFYHVSSTASTVDEFTGLWFALLHHVTNEHSWVLDCGGGICECSHGPLTDERELEWLEKGSAAHDALREIICDRRFLNNIPYYLNARSTAELETLNSLVLMYAAKRFSYTPPVYRARNLLAALDHNYHLQREQKLNKDGSARVCQSFNKKSARWTVRPVKEQKTYPHMATLIRNVFQLRLSADKPLSSVLCLAESDPRRISRNIAPVEPPSKKELIEQFKSRFSKND